MIRAILVYLETFVMLIVGIPVMLVLCLMNKFAPKKAARIAQNITGGAQGILTRTALGREKLTVRGLENIPRDCGVLFVSNHRSFFDIIMSYSILPVQTGFISKDDLKKVPLIRQWMEILNCQFLNRKNIRQGVEVIKRAAEVVKNGGSIWICPEGTRNKNEDNTTLLEFHEASLKIADWAGCPVVPVAIYGTDRVWERQFPWMKPYPVTIEFGKPFRAKELGPEWKKKKAQYAAERIREMLLQEKERREKR